MDAAVNRARLPEREWQGAPRRLDSLFQRGGRLRRPHETASRKLKILDHATSEMASGSKLGIDATKKLPGEGFKRSWPPLIRMNEEIRRKIDALFGARSARAGHRDS